MTGVKICGLKRVKDGLAAVEAGADLLGFVFAPSRRRIEPEMAAEIIAQLRGVSVVKMVGVFVNEDVSHMNRMARLCGLDYVQLSGPAEPHIPGALDVPAIQTFHVGDDDSPEALAQRVEGSDAALVLLDTARAGSFGGTGATFDWHLLTAIHRPYILAGGLRPDNVAVAIHTVRPWGVDVSSGVETDGEKDPAKIHAFVRAVKDESTTVQVAGTIARMPDNEL